MLAQRVEVPVEVTDAVLPGVVSLPHGWGHDRDSVRLRVAHEHAGASINDVTDERHLDTLSGTAAFNGLAVTVRGLMRAQDTSGMAGDIPGRARVPKTPV